MRASLHLIGDHLLLASIMFGSTHKRANIPTYPKNKTWSKHKNKNCTILRSPTVPYGPDEAAVQRHFRQWKQGIHKHGAYAHKKGQTIYGHNLQNTESKTTYEAYIMIPWQPLVWTTHPIWIIWQISKVSEVHGPTNIHRYIIIYQQYGINYISNPSKYHIWHCKSNIWHLATTIISLNGSNWCHPKMCFLCGNLIYTRP